MMRLKAIKAIKRAEKVLIGAKDNFYVAAKQLLFFICKRKIVSQASRIVQKYTGIQTTVPFSAKCAQRKRTFLGIRIDFKICGVAYI